MTKPLSVKIIVFFVVILLFIFNVVCILNYLPYTSTTAQFLAPQAKVLLLPLRSAFARAKVLPLAFARAKGRARRQELIFQAYRNLNESLSIE
jgi:Na+/alanine symporter